ncbi:MAG: DNA polymerase III subunit beta [Flavobacteriales bacterium]|nr:DNA polymerase III subunit beta [Flavobacteriales bacterium]
MKFIVSSEVLLKKLQLIGGVLNASNTLPILDDFLFQIKKGELMITASDLETTMVTKISIEAKEDGDIAMPAKLLMDTLKTFPDQPLTFTIDKENFGIEISTGEGKYKLTGHDVSEFPKTPKLESPDSITVEGSVLANAVNKTLFATGNDELRPVMSGVFFEINNDNVTFVATDAHKLVKYTRVDLKADKGAAFILPKKPLNLLKSVLGSVGDEVTIEYNDTNAMFVFGSTKMIARLIDGKYPNYNAVIPTENPNKLTIGRNQLLNSVKRISIFSNKTTHQVRLKMSGSELHISAEDLDFANEANERLTCQYEGEDMEIGFNSRFLIEMLSNLESDEVSIAMSAPNRAGILTPCEKTDDAEEILMLVMPVMLNN